MATIAINNHLALAKDLTRLLETQFRIRNFKFGLDPILGLIPGVGDFVALILSFYIVWIGIQMRVPPDKLVLMMGNIAYDFFLGIIPILGDIADFTFKANTKNLKILSEFAPEGIFEGELE